MSKKFFDYIDRHKIDINSLDSKKILKISLDTGLKFNYVEVLKLRYSDKKKVPLTKEDVIWSIQKFNGDIEHEKTYDIFDEIDKKDKAIMCKYLEEHLRRDVSVYLFDKVRGS